MSDSNIPCEGAWSTLHKLACGHTVRVDAILFCRANCEQMATQHASTVQYVYASTFVCEECVRRDFVRAMFVTWRAPLDRLVQAKKLADADDLVQKAFDGSDFEKLGYWEKYEAYRYLRMQDAIEAGGAFGHSTSIAPAMNELNDLLKSVDIGAEGIELKPNEMRQRRNALVPQASTANGGNAGQQVTPRPVPTQQDVDDLASVMGIMGMA